MIVLVILGHFWVQICPKNMAKKMRTHTHTHVKFSIHIFLNVIYFCDSKAEFSAAHKSFSTSMLI